MVPLDMVRVDMDLYHGGLRLSSSRLRRNSYSSCSSNSHCSTSPRNRSILSETWTSGTTFILEGRISMDLDLA